MNVKESKVAGKDSPAVDLRELRFSQHEQISTPAVGVKEDSHNYIKLNSYTNAELFSLISCMCNSILEVISFYPKNQYQNAFPCLAMPLHDT